MQAIKNRFKMILRRNTERSVIEISSVEFDSIVRSMLSIQEIEKTEIEKLNLASRRAMKKNKDNKKRR